MLPLSASEVPECRPSLLFPHWQGTDRRVYHDSAHSLPHAGPSSVQPWRAMCCRLQLLLGRKGQQRMHCNSQQRCMVSPEVGCRQLTSLQHQERVPQAVAPRRAWSRARSTAAARQRWCCSSMAGRWNARPSSARLKRPMRLFCLRPPSHSCIWYGPCRIATLLHHSDDCSRKDTLRSLQCMRRQFRISAPHSLRSDSSWCRVCRCQVSMWM